MSRGIAAVTLLLVGMLTACAGPPPPPRIPEPQRTTIVGVGDILLGRSLGKRMEEAGDYALAFRRIAEELKAADIAAGNLEGPLCGEGPYPGEGMTFRVRPRAIESLQYAGLDVVSLANNHFADGGEKCMTFTLEALARAGIASAGAGRTYEEAHRAAIVERRGLRFAFLAYTYAARNDLPGATGGVIAGRNPERVREDVARALAQAHAVIVLLHDGAEYTRSVAQETIEFARAAIDAGAAAVIGHHPHVPQRVEQHGQGWIFYSLGNFVFQQNTPPETRTGLMARLTLVGARVERVEAAPVVIEFHSTPRPATPEEARKILAPIGLSRSVVYSLLPE